MHRIINSYLKTFCDENSIPETINETKRFEYFSNYCVIKSFYPEEINAEDITSEENDTGIDGIAFIIDGELVTSIDEAQTIFSRPKRNISVDIYFIQSKISESYDRGEILKFGSGVNDFLAEEPTLPRGSFIRESRKIFDLLIENVSKIMNGRPRAHLRYICTSTNDIAKEIEAARKSILKEVENTHLFFEVDYEFLGFDELSKLWKKTRNPVTALIQTNKLIPFPEMSSVSQAYLAIVPLKAFVNSVLIDDERRMRVHIFEENIRAFLGTKNGVNEQIAASINDPEKQNRFAILNNGITIIAPSVKVQGEKISIENYQIVNGCQTCNVLFENYETLEDQSTVTIKVIEVDNPEVVADVVKATNSQTQIANTQFISYTTFIRKIEQYFLATEDIQGEEVKLYLERRVGQYRNQPEIPKNRVFSTVDVCRSVAAMFFHMPDVSGRNPSKMIIQNFEAFTNNKNKEIAFYAATLALYRFKLLVRNGSIPHQYAIYKWHILAILSFTANNYKQLPKITNKKIESFCKALIKKCSRTDEECVNVYKKAIEVIDAVGLEDRDTIRSAGYTQRLIDYCRSKNKVQVLSEI